ncbi:MAG: hypothetical protein AUI14_15850 [Actinobacteria bacterium 13_2_20CM_2_71_6]|nr:MAG: hypothetical protein AUI14_15850 [Actinobacteria bacterium 13_2_20CM_2_71_6]
MVTLRLNQSVLADGRHRVTVRLDGDAAPQEGVSDFAFTLTDADREDVRWYLEDFLEYPLDPAPAIAARVERRLTGIGTELFRLAFADENAREA